MSNACSQLQIVSIRLRAGTVAEKSEKLSSRRRKKRLRQLFNANSKDTSNLKAT